MGGGASLAVLVLPLGWEGRWKGDYVPRVKGRRKRGAEHQFCAWEAYATMDWGWQMILLAKE